MSDDREGATSPLDSRNPLYWVQGDPLFGEPCTGRNDPDALAVCSEERRIDWCMACLAEIEPSAHDVWLYRWTQQGTITARQCCEILRLLGRYVP